MKTLEITEAQASALIALAGRISASVADETVATPISEDVNPFDASPSTPSTPSVTDILEAQPELAELSSSMPVFASAPVVETPVEAPVVDPQADAKAIAKAQRKAENQAANRAINAQLANATKAHTSGDAGAVVEALNKAMALVPDRKDKNGNYTWQSTIDRIVEKAHALGVA